MSLLDRVLQQPEFNETPPVLVDVGAAGGVPRVWRPLARYAVAIAFEPDAREAAPLTRAQREFKRWIYVPALVTPVAAPDGQVDFYLTQSPQCSSTLQPNADAVRRWALAPFFAVQEKRKVSAATLEATLQNHQLPGVDWLKCDSQGLDLRLFQSLSPDRRDRVLLAEFEPGLVDAYRQEDTMDQVLSAMRQTPFVLTECQVERMPLALTGSTSTAWFRRLAPDLPAWGNLVYLRDLATVSELLGRREYLLLWVFATVQRQYVMAHNVAAAGLQRWNVPLFAELQRASARQVRWAMLRRLPRWFFRRMARHFGL